VPWDHVPILIDTLEGLKAEFEEAAADFISRYPQLRAEWQAAHRDVPNALYPELASRQLRTEQLGKMKENLTRECQQFAADYVTTFRNEVAEFCDAVISAKGQVHGKTLNSIRDRIDRFHAMNVFGDADAASKLAQLKQQIAGLTGQDLAQQPDVAAKLSAACQAIKNTVRDPANVSKLTGRLKRRVVLD
jgi:hypothetical protein